MKLALPLTSATLTAALGVVASGQTVLQEFTGPPGVPYFGCAIMAPGDVTGDGIDDVAVSVCNREVRVYSGADWSIHTVHPAPAYASNYGLNLAALGDIDGDGLGDYAIAQPTSLDYRGTVWVHSGGTGALIRRFEGPVGDFLGVDLGSAGDVDGDGVQDLAAHALNGLIPGVEIEYVLVWSGATGDELLRIDAPALSVWYGLRLGGVGDTDGDGHGDLALSYDAGTGFGLEVRSGATGALLFEHFSATGRYWGRPVALGDVDGDLRDDFAVPTWTSVGDPASYSLHVVSGTGALLAEVDDITGLRAGASIRDLDGDGARDLVIGDQGPDGSVPSLTIRSGRTGELLARYDGPPGAYLFAADVAVINDVNGDGAPDIAINENTSSTFGVVRVLSGAAVGPLTRFCDAAPSSVGPGARLEASGSLSVLDDDLQLMATGLPPGAFGLFIRGAESSSFPFGDGLLCVSPFSGGLVRIETVRAAASGVAETAGIHGPPFPGSEIVVGTSWTFQLLYRDVLGGPAGFNSTDALRGTFVP